MKCTGAGAGFPQGMRPILLLLSLALASMPALERICELRCATATVSASASPAEAGHCAGMPDEPDAPLPSEKGHPCGHGHGDGALISAASGAPARIDASGRYAAAPAVLSSTPSTRADLPGRGLLLAARTSESPPRGPSSPILRL